MKVIDVPTGANGKPAPTTQTAQTANNSSARQRAISIMQSGAPQAAPTEQPTPVANPNSISPEEMTALNTAKPSEEEEKGQNLTSDAEMAEKPAVETKEEAKAPSEEETLSTKYANLARKEKALRAKAQAQEAALKAEREALAAKEAQIRSEIESKYIPKDRLSQNPLEVLNQLGLTYDQITELALNGPKPEEMAYKQKIEALEAKLAALETNTNETRKSIEDREKAQYEQAKNQIRNEAQALVLADPEFEMIKETGSLDDVVDLIEQTFKSDGILLTVKEAAREVEEYLVEEAMKIARAKKIQQKLAPAPKAEQKITEQPKQQPTIKTLTNTMASGRQLSSRERAILAFKGELK